MLSETQWESVGRCKWCGVTLYEKDYGQRQWHPDWDDCLHEVEGGEDGDTVLHI